MCHQHLREERQMTRIVECDSCLDIRKYKQSVTGLNGDSQGRGGRRFKKQSYIQFPAVQQGYQCEKENHPSLSLPG